MYLNRHVFVMNTEKQRRSMIIYIVCVSKVVEYLEEYVVEFAMSSRKHAYIILTPLNPTFI